LLGGVLAGDSWRPWRILLIAMMGEPLDAEERVIFAELTGRPTEPLERCEEFWGVIGRRGGKSRAIAVLCTYIAASRPRPRVEFFAVRVRGSLAGISVRGYPSATRARVAVLGRWKRGRRISSTVRLWALRSSCNFAS
jgi:hypothetical protein